MDEQSLLEKQIASKLQYDGKVIKLYVDEVELPDGNHSVREYCKHIGAVAVLPLTHDNRVICVEQYRYAHRQCLLEIPAGKLDSADENHREAALRELREETGCTCESLVSLGLYRSTPAVLNECIDLYLARGLSYGDQDLDEDEFLKTKTYALNDLVQMVMRGEITDGKTQLAVLKTYFLLKEEENA